MNGWIGDLAQWLEAEFFRKESLTAKFKDYYGTGEIRGLKVEDIVNQIVERFGLSARDQLNATTDIASAIESIRQMGLDVRRSTDEQRHGSVLIMNSITEVSGLISHIAEATQDQTKSAENIHHALEVFREVTSDTNVSVEAINQMVAMLSERAAKLESEIGRFRTE